MPAPLPAHHLAELLEELRPLVVGRRLLEIAPLPPRDLLLVFEVEGTDHVRRVRVSAAPDGPRIHLQHGRVFQHKGSVGPFFGQLSKELADSRLLGLEQPRQDRLVLLQFERGDGERRGLIAELVGRHANLILVDRAERVLALLVTPPPKAGQEPRLSPGQPWVPPPGSPRPPAPDDPGLAGSLPEPNVPEGAGPKRIFGPLSWRVEWHLGGDVEGLERERETKRVRERLERRRGRADKLLRGLAERRSAADRSDRVRQDGELLKHALGQFERGARSVELSDWYGPDGGTRRIELDPKLSPQANVQRFFDRAQKLERSIAAIDREEQLAKDQLARLDRCLEAIARPEADPNGIEAEAVELGLLDPLKTERGQKKQQAAARLPYREFTGLHGATILVGRNARDNDQLSLKVARGNDTWLHTADSPGSHVVLRVAKGSEPHPEDLLDAAHLAAHFSPQKNAAQVDVLVSQAKHVSKSKGMPAGLVNVAASRTRRVRIESDRLERLLGTRGGSQGKA
jgi:predicted ribosome quality control (RQC) complex YloA/Tae2 family protein